MSGPRQDLPVVNAFWHGSLSWLERLCLGSFVRHGHQVHLYAYDPIPDLPAGVELKPAGDVVDRSRLVFYKGRGTPGVFSDLFRASLLQQGRGLYVDADVYCLKPLDFDRDGYLVGYERNPSGGDAGSINGAVLLIPQQSPLIDDLLSIFAEGPRPLLEPHLPPIRRAEVAVRRLFGQKVSAEYMQYGATGPAALTYFIRRLKLIDKVLPADIFYPVPYAGIPHLLEPGSDILGRVTPASRTIHIWRSQLTRRGRSDLRTPPAGSPLHSLCVENGVVL